MCLYRHFLKDELMAYCVDCGEKLANEINFCPRCGTKKYISTPDEPIQNIAEQEIPNKVLLKEEPVVLPVQVKDNFWRFILLLIALPLILFFLPLFGPISCGSDLNPWVPVTTEEQLMRLMVILAPLGDYALIDLLTPDNERSSSELNALRRAVPFDFLGRSIRFAYRRDMSEYAMRLDE